MSDELQMRPRGIGLNVLPCFICGHGGDGFPAQPDMASFVADQKTGEAIVALFTRVGLKATLDTRRAREGRFQVKVGACGEHEPNLWLLMFFARNHPDRTLTIQKLYQCIPGEKVKRWPLSDHIEADEMLARISVAAGVSPETTEDETETP